MSRKNYGTDIYKRLEFLKDLAAVFPRAEKLEKAWISQSKAYRIDFYATMDKIASFTFEPSALGVFGPPCDADLDLDEETRIKRWLILRACDMANGYSGHEFVYIRDDVGIPPNQITSYTLL